tara:strand:+ start:890 stop:1096 length:207 start_codon:yes stop_codon:yes gene_type:complete
MSYHPIIGITIFLFSLIIAYLMGRKIFKFNSSNNINQKEINSNKKNENKFRLNADAQAPDAPWIKNKE